MKRRVPPPPTRGAGRTVAEAAGPPGTEAILPGSAETLAGPGPGDAPRSGAESREPLTESPAWKLVGELHTLMKAVMIHDANHPVAANNARTVCDTVQRASPPFVLAFVAGGVFFDRTLIPLDFLHFEYCRALTHSLNRLKAHELSFDGGLDEEGARRLGAALAAGMRGGGDVLKEGEIQGLSWREIPFAQSGIDAEGVDSEVAAITHTVLGLSTAEQLAERRNEPWHWNMGLAVIRRLEKGMGAKVGTAMRVVEFAPEGWPVPRRALSASQLVLQVLNQVGTSSAHARAAAHVTLALALQGLRAQDGIEISEAANALVARMTANPIQAKSGIAPQCLLVTSLAHRLGRGRRRGRSSGGLVVEGLIKMAYDMERARCPRNVPFALTRADLLAHALQQGDARYPYKWLRVIIGICGAVPVGTHVQIADGRVGIVIEPGPPEQPWCPVVFIEGKRVMTRRPVKLVPPHKLRRVSVRTRRGGH
jgi:hypothetical protein